MRFDLDVTVDRLQSLLRGDRFGQSRGDIRFVIQHLPLQVVQFQKIPIDNPQPAHSGASERVRQYGP